MLADCRRKRRAEAGGRFLASAARGTVFWPAEAAWPKQFAEVYPQPAPPLRCDRDTVVIGKGTLQAGRR